MSDLTIRGFLHRLLVCEVIWCVGLVPGTDLACYVSLIEGRFSNLLIGDTISRLAQDGSNRQPKFILPSVSDRLLAGLDVSGLALVSALWCRYFEGVSESGRAIVFNDVHAERLRAAADRSLSDPLAFLDEGDIFGWVSRDERFRSRFEQALRDLRTKGTRATLAAYVGQPSVPGG